MFAKYRFTLIFLLVTFLLLPLTCHARQALNSRQYYLHHTLVPDGLDDLHDLINVLSDSQYNVINDKQLRKTYGRIKLYINMIIHDQAIKVKQNDIVGQYTIAVTLEIFKQLTKPLYPYITFCVFSPTGSIMFPNSVYTYYAIIDTLTQNIKEFERELNIDAPDYIVPLAVFESCVNCDILTRQGLNKNKMVQIAILKSTIIWLKLFVKYH